MDRVAAMETSLDPKKQTASSYIPSTPPDGPDDRLHDILFRHSGWRGQRDSVYKCLRRSQSSIARIARFADCGHSAYLVRDRFEPTVVTVRAEYCHDRFCLPCNVARSRRVAARVAELCDGKHVRFITLTLASTDEGLRQKLTRLQTSFRRLRAASTWKSHVLGGVVFMEIKRSQQLDNWHVHLHALVEGTYFPHQQLVDLWHTITKDSFVVHITRPHGSSRVASYVAKYLAKPVDLHLFRDIGKGLEVLDALHGRRMSQCFGTWRGQKLNDTPDPHTWDVVCSLAHLRKLATLGNDCAAELLALLQRQRTCQLSVTQQQELARAPPSGDSPCGTTDPPTVRSAVAPWFNDFLCWGPEF